jgi:spore germination protein GerM
MRISPAVALFALVLLLASCRETVVSAAATADSPATLRTTLYFLTEEGAVPLGTRREIVERTPPPWGSVAGGALEALLAGPTAEEASAGLTTAIPPGTRLITLDSRGKGGTGAVVGLSGLDAVDDALERARVITQIVRTLVGISGSSVERVWLLEEGQPWGMYLMDGRVDNGPFDYGTLGGFHLGAACPGTETVECDHFDALP